MVGSCKMSWVKLSLSPIIPNKLSVDEMRLVHDGHDHTFSIACCFGFDASDELDPHKDRWKIDY